MEDVVGMTFEEDVDLGTGSGGYPRTPQGKKWKKKYDLGSVLTVSTRDSDGHDSSFSFCFRKGLNEGGVLNTSNDANIVIAGEASAARVSDARKVFPPLTSKANI